MPRSPGGVGVGGIRSAAPSPGGSVVAPDGSAPSSVTRRLARSGHCRAGIRRQCAPARRSIAARPPLDGGHHPQSREGQPVRPVLVGYMASAARRKHRHTPDLGLFREPDVRPRHGIHRSVLKPANVRLARQYPFRSQTPLGGGRKRPDPVPICLRPHWATSLVAWPGRCRNVRRCVGWHSGPREPPGTEFGAMGVTKGTQVG